MISRQLNTPNARVLVVFANARTSWVTIQLDHIVRTEPGTDEDHNYTAVDLIAKRPGIICFDNSRRQW